MAKVIVGTAVGTLIGFVCGIGLTGAVLAKDEERGVELVHQWSKRWNNVKE